MKTLADLSEHYRCYYCNEEVFERGFCSECLDTLRPDIIESVRICVEYMESTRGESDVKVE